MERHGRAEWHDIDQKLGHGVSCPKLKSYWHFHGSRYEKVSRTCAEPDHIGCCPLDDCGHPYAREAEWELGTGFLAQASVRASPRITQTDFL
jgi:hypothetical protein